MRGGATGSKVLRTSVCSIKSPKSEGWGSKGFVSAALDPPMRVRGTMHHESGGTDHGLGAGFVSLKLAAFSSVPGTGRPSRRRGTAGSNALVPLQSADR